MLQELSIRNYALIDELHLSFPGGLVLITGETGAGKSIVIDALGLVLGGRASGQDAIRSGADRCIVEAVFDLSDTPAATRSYLEQEGLIDDGDALSLVVTRELTRAGRNQCRVNGHLLPVASLRAVTEGLVDIHGQHEHQTLLAPERHLDLLDQWLGGPTLAQRDEVRRTYEAASTLRRDLHTLRETAKERARNLDLYRFQQDEIVSASLRIGEEEEMASERTRLLNAEKLQALASEAYEAVSEIALDGLNSALSAAEKGGSLDDGLASSVEQLSQAVDAAEEARRSLRSYRDGVEFNPSRLEEIEERLSLIRGLKRKYGETVAEINSYGEELAEKLNLLAGSEERDAQLSNELVRAESDLAEMAERLSDSRHRGAGEFGSAILCELQDLGMAQTRFEVQVASQHLTACGADRVEFMISPNPGEPLKPLAKIASGGELSRMMLALKSVLSRAAYVPTLIFDEIDVGIGGRTALAIARKLAALAQTAQVFCITHLPQIASQPAAAHFVIEKLVEQGRTTIRLQPLTPQERVGEIARMLGGSHHSPTVIQHATEMLAGAIPASK